MKKLLRFTRPVHNRPRPAVGRWRFALAVLLARPFGRLLVVAALPALHHRAAGRQRAAVHGGREGARPVGHHSLSLVFISLLIGLGFISRPGCFFTTALCVTTIYACTHHASTKKETGLATTLARVLKPRAKNMERPPAPYESIVHLFTTDHASRIHMGTRGFSSSSPSRPVFDPAGSYSDDLLLGQAFSRPGPLAPNCHPRSD
jgi:hypothetical protein